jgi:hypothetical protein
MRWVMLAFVVLVAATLTVDKAQYAMGVAAMATLGFLLVGFAMFPHRDATLDFSFGPFPPEVCGHRFVIVGLAVEASPFRKMYVCRLPIRNGAILILSGLLALATVIVVASDVPLMTYLHGGGVFLAEICLIALALALHVSTRWYQEQILLSHAHVTLGSTSSVGAKTLAYQFFDAAGERRGGIERDFFSRSADDALLIFYDARDPDRNSSSRGFMFRDLAVMPAAQAP